MSEVYIRSQNKEKLYRLGGNYACVEYGEYEDVKKKRAVRGVIANKPTYRETPRGKRITDITVKVRNELTGGSCFLPCICWQEQADEAAQWQQGDTVELLGRYQSRQYEKVLDAATGEREQRTAYEVSVRLIRRKEEAENEC